MNYKWIGILALIIAFIGFSGPKADAQYLDQVKYPNIIKINPFSILALTGNLQYERAVHNKVSVQLGVFGTGLSFKFFGLFKIGYSGYGITPEVRYYAAGRAMKGFYVGGYARFQQFFGHASIKVQAVNPVDGKPYVADGSLKATVTSIGGGGILGYELTAGRFVFDLFFGLGYNHMRSKVVAEAEITGVIDDDVEWRFPLLPLGIRFGIALGVAF